MLRVLVPVDGSENSIRAVDHVLKKAAWYKEPLEIHLLNVQHPLHGEVRMFLDAEQIRAFHHDEGTKALESARKILDGAGLPYIVHIGVGNPAEVIVQYAKEKACDQIVMSARGLGSVAALLMGSVATKVIHLSEVPVLLVK
ncbi:MULTISPECIES: universal stress protein [Methylocaldum]|jgi:nucleotide-binding universal stress UspA family protein|uniref:universal stress protein n=1 Tax=Methylocaldum sp. GT1TLB TaxID=3438965 RepID=UPI0012EBD1A8|nr:universal stress protein [Methylocaldum sp. BRCS4]